MSKNSNRILILSTSYLPLVGGSELAIKEMTDRLREYQFDLITARVSKNLPAEEKIGAINVFRVGNDLSLFRFLLPKNFLPLAIFWKAWALIRSGRHYDAVHAFQASQAAGAGWLLKWLKPELPLLVTLQEGQNLADQPRLTRWFRKLIMKKADRASVISRYLKDYLVSIRRDLPGDLIPNGVDWENFSRECSSGEVSEWRKQLEIMPGEKVIISTSRLTFKNGLDNLIRALAVLERQISSRYRLLLVGEGELRQSYEKLADELGIADRVIFTGTVSHVNLIRYLKTAQVFVRPSRSEGLGSAFLEAMAAGLPVIGPAVGGIPDFLTHGVTGLTCDANNPEDIAEKIKLIVEDEILRNKIIKNARELIEKKYTWDQIAPEYQKLYEDIHCHSRL